MLDYSVIDYLFAQVKFQKLNNKQIQCIFVSIVVIYLDIPLLYSSVILCNLSIYYVIVFIHHITFEIVAQCSRKVQKDVIFFNVN